MAENVGSFLKYKAEDFRKTLFEDRGLGKFLFDSSPSQFSRFGLSEVFVEHLTSSMAMSKLPTLDIDGETPRTYKDWDEVEDVIITTMVNSPVGRERSERLKRGVERDALKAVKKA